MNTYKSTKYCSKCSLQYDLQSTCSKFGGTYITFTCVSCRTDLGKIRSDRGEYPHVIGMSHVSVACGGRETSWLQQTSRKD